MQSISVYLFTDSTDVLFWLKDHPSKWPTFIANRCSKIHSLLPEAYWSHVRTHENTADCASRGILPDQLGKFSLWWEGNSTMKKEFSFRRNENSFRPKSIIGLNFNLATKITKKTKVTVNSWELLEKYSNYKKLLRMSAYILHFVYNVLLKVKSKILSTSNLFSNKWFKLSNEPNLVSLSVTEINTAKLVWVYLTQKSYFQN